MLSDSSISRTHDSKVESSLAIEKGKQMSRENWLPVRITNNTTNYYVAILSGYGTRTALLAPGESCTEKGDEFNSIDGLAVYRVGSNGILNLVNSYDNRESVASGVWKISNGFGRGNGRLSRSGGKIVFDLPGIAMSELESGEASYFIPRLRDNYNGRAIRSYAVPQPVAP